MSKKRKNKVKLSYVLLVFLSIIVLLLVVLYFLVFKNYGKSDDKDYLSEKLVEIGYNENEIGFFREKLSDDEINKIYSYDYLPFLESLIGIKDYQQEKMVSYIDYIKKIDGDYNLENVVYLVNSNIDYPYSEKLINLVKAKYFINSRIDRYMKYDSDDINTIITNVNSNLDHKFYVDTNPTDTSKETLLIVNKYYYLAKDYHYGDLVVMDKRYDNKTGSKLNSIAYEAFKRLVDDAQKDGYYIRNNSAYRSYDYQNSLYSGYKSSNGLTWADKWSARPGHSEHQTGLALDVGVKGQLSLSSFEGSKEFTWMKEHAHLYGFILRYPEGKEYITGYGYEPWHYRYVGVDVATYIYENNITFEEYYAYFVENKV